MNPLIKLLLDHRRGSRFSIYSLTETFSARGMDTPLLGEQIDRRVRVRTNLFFGAGLAFWLATFLILIIFSASPPISTFEQAWMALGAARRAEANVYATEEFLAARQNWEKAMRSWARENKKWFFQRDFEKAFDLAKATRLRAQQAESVAVAARDSLQFVTLASLAFVRQKVDEFKMQFAHVPVAAALRKKFVAGELLMMESQFAFNRQDYKLSTNKVRQAEVLVGSAGDGATKLLRVYLAKVPEWQRWVAETIAWSERESATAIIVDKMAHTCEVYVAGKKRTEFPIELGPRWVGHKQQKGDNATPEGHYYITKKKNSRHTKYYKALEINYPNENDREQFIAAKERGDLPRSAQIGGLIEIHGEGGKGVNWTSGCVALRNQHMDEIFDLTKIGTRVTIVGSLKTQPALARSPINLPKKALNGFNNRSASSK
jgi:lipoprotein-anchoring transpeptidase ErfK/SrfK